MKTKNRDKDGVNFIIGIHSLSIHLDHGPLEPLEGISSCHEKYPSRSKTGQLFFSERLFSSEWKREIPIRHS